MIEFRLRRNTAATPAYPVILSKAKDPRFPLLPQARQKSSRKRSLNFALRATVSAAHPGDSWKFIARCHNFVPFGTYEGDKAKRKQVMTRLKILALLCGVLVAAPIAASADPWKDESGHGRDRDRRGGYYDDRRGDYRDKDHDRWGERGGRDRDRREEDRGWDDRRGYPFQHGRPYIPPGHQPPAGECRNWLPNTPAGQQPPPYRC